MIKYKHVVTSNNRNMYFVNGKLQKPELVPQGIKNILEPGVELTTDGVADTLPDFSSAEQAINTAPPIPSGGTVTVQTVDDQANNRPKSKKDKKECIFCGEPGDRTRFVNLQTIDLCDEDYNSHTTGEIAAQVREAQAV